MYPYPSPIPSWPIILYDHYYIHFPDLALIFIIFFILLLLFLVSYLFITFSSLQPLWCCHIRSSRFHHAVPWFPPMIFSHSLYDMRFCGGLRISFCSFLDTTGSEGVGRSVLYMIPWNLEPAFWRWPLAFVCYDSRLSFYRLMHACSQLFYTTPYVIRRRPFTPSRFALVGEHHRSIPFTIPYNVHT